MTTIEVGEDDAGSGVVALVVTVVELLVEALEREAIRRMESDALDPDEVDELGRQLAAIEAELDSLKESQEIDDSVENLRADLDGLLTDAIRQVDERERGSTSFDHPIFGGDAE